MKAKNLTRRQSTSTISLVQFLGKISTTVTLTRRRLDKFHGCGRAAESPTDRFKVSYKLYKLIAIQQMTAYDDDDEPLEMIMTNGKYQWGFDLTDFNPNGNEKFQGLLQEFGMEIEPEVLTHQQIPAQKFIWKNQAGDLSIITSNNPITGTCGISMTSQIRLTGYLGYVGVECNSPDLLTTFLDRFRELATDIKEESNARVYA
jgi:hypothetical protein